MDNPKKILRVIEITKTFGQRLCCSAMSLTCGLSANLANRGGVWSFSFAARRRRRYESKIVSTPRRSGLTDQSSTAGDGAPRNFFFRHGDSHRRDLDAHRSAEFGN